MYAPVEWPEGDAHLVDQRRRSIVECAEVLLGAVGVPFSAAEADTKGRRNRRGRRKANYEVVQSEAKLAAKWQRAHESGEYKPDFAKQEGMTTVKFDDLLDRVAARKRRSDK